MNPVPKLLPGMVHLYELDLDSFACDDVLSEDERARAARFKFDRDRKRFSAGRCALRMLLGLYVNKPPKTLSFSYGPASKPSLPGISFNLAHSGPHALIAIAAEARVGVDIEEVRSFPDMDDVAKSVFSPRELQRWRELSGAKTVDGFYRLWTRKEAYLKGIGEGIAHRLQKVEISFEDPPRIIAGAEGTWTLRDVSKSADIIAAVACEAPNVSIESFSLGSA